ncbi:MAG: IS630 family transposase [Gemmatimonadaceae bacterium]|jgi:transposase|nr:IS630 family transposase [Gemmatimonadaceae bacterium]
MPPTRDARKLATPALQLLRAQVVRAVDGGMTQTAAAIMFGASLRAVQKWMALARTGAPDALTLKRRGRRPGSGALSAAQVRQIRRLVVNKMPDQLALPFYLWTREAVRQLIAQRTGVRLALTTVGQYVRTWGLTPQKPTRRAYERNDAAITRWLATEYPAIAAAATRDRATIHWADEMGGRSDHVTGTTDAPVGQPPAVRATGQRFGCTVISAITNRGAVACRVFHGRFTAPVFIDFLKRLLQQASGKLVVIVDGHPVHRAARVSAFVRAHAARQTLVRMPGHCPELTPDDLLHQDVKTNSVGKRRPTDRAGLIRAVRRHLHRRQKQPHVIRALFRERHVRYAA